MRKIIISIEEPPAMLAVLRLLNELKANLSIAMLMWVLTLRVSTSVFFFFLDELKYFHKSCCGAEENVNICATFCVSVIILRSVFVGFWPAGGAVWSLPASLSDELNRWCGAKLPSAPGDAVYVPLDATSCSSPSRFCARPNQMFLMFFFSSNFPDKLSNIAETFQSCKCCNANPLAVLQPGAEKTRYDYSPGVTVLIEIF